MKSSRQTGRVSRGALSIACVIASLGFWMPAARAQTVQCCSGFTQQCAGTKSMWCVQNGAPAGTLPSAFCPYGDEVVSELETLFNIQAPQTFEFDVLWPPTGGAQTPTECGTFGNAVTGDAFTNVSYGVTGFYGYLLSLHEAINQWTGLSTPGWPTDYWADHVSAFPNEMDWRIMGTLGASLSDANLVAASPAQKARFWPGGDSEDSRVQMFDNMFILPNMGDGYQGFSRIFSYVQGDALNWNNLALNGANPDERRSEYVAAYLSLGAGQSVLPIMQTPSAGYSSTTSWPVCDGAWDGVSGDPNPSYTCSEANIDAIATAHCAIAANGKPAADLASLQAGNYAAVKSGPCGATCPSECGCKTATNECVAPWLGDATTKDAGGGAEGGTGDGGGSGSGSGGGGSSGGGLGLSDDGGTSGSGGGSGGSTAAGGDAGNGESPGGSASSGCGCMTVGSSGGSSRVPGLFVGAALAVLVFVRRRRR
jgi:MYXO-CTERM domain-containing protein